MRDNSCGAIVLAAGSGLRFAGHKQFEHLGGERLVDRAVGLVRAVCAPVVLVLPDGVAWTGLPVDALAIGGATRIDSLRNALVMLTDDVAVVVIHDAVRPLATHGQIGALIAAIAAGADAAIPVWQPPDVIKRVNTDGSLTHVGREGYVIAQGPTACRVASLRQALAGAQRFIDETQAIEAGGGRVVGVPGDPWSHHIVAPRDLSLMARLVD